MCRYIMGCVGVRYLLVALVFTLTMEGLVGCTDDSDPVEITQPRPDFRMVGLSDSQKEQLEFNNWLAFELLKEISTNPKHSNEKNKVFSPVNVYSLLSLLANGADGVCSEEILSVLLKSDEGDAIQRINDLNSILIKEFPLLDPTVAILMRNALWINRYYDLNEGFHDIFSNAYDGEYYSADFSDKKSLRTQINNWVEKNTSGLIKDFLQEQHLINEVAYIVNTSYFKGTWREKFPVSNSEKSVFHAASGDRKVTMMHIQENFSYYGDESVQTVVLPYGSGNFNMYVFLPAEGMDFGEYVKGFTLDDFEYVNSNLTTHEVHLGMPKFSVKSRFELNEDDFWNMGIHSIFSKGLSGICKDATVDMEKLMIQTCISVDESGTEAAAASTVLGWTSPSPFIKTAEMTVNRPFVFVIKENSTGAIIYLGCVENP